ncbi:MAG: HD domain-containing protein [Cypionkella sp.]|uniref:HD domain-containing protein n=1 Tax=Cypionkella sp. TaxID=2811411 RepID=UPI002ABBC4DE|nr:HD domain-containing protein [Cypionkella sp.]MDZ4312589.1 HD domain-containing protein [Cypionkella sp.]MDZ4393219.1 HD domain-containing protein [Cypionkella sp.]
MTHATTQSRYETEVIRQWSAHPADGAHDLGHLRRVWARAKLIAMDEPCDLEVLLPACIFHDLVNLPKSHPERARASTLSAEAACHFLRADGFPAAKLSAVGHAIAAHSFSAAITPVTAEARVLQDADRLEALGAIGIARMFHVSGAMGGGLFDAEDPMALHRPRDDRAFALDHIETKLLKLVDTMQTAPGRAMAIERADWMLSFRTRLLFEIG